MYVRGRMRAATGEPTAGWLLLCKGALAFYGVSGRSMSLWNETGETEGHMGGYRAGGCAEHEKASEVVQTGRRAFLQKSFGALLGLVAAAVAWPMVASLVSPSYRKAMVHFTKVPGFRSMPVGQPVRLSFPDVTVDAYMREHEIQDVWAIKHSTTEVTVFSPICTHLGCHHSWHPERHEFICPCHGSLFAITGQVIGGPALRPLDTLPYKIENGELWVQWERFLPGTPEKIPV